MTTRRLLPSLCLGALLPVALCLLSACGKDAKTTAKATDSTLKTDEQKVSYGVGYNIGKSTVEQGAMNVDLPAFRLGLEDGLAKAGMKVTDQDLRAAFQVIQQRAAASAAAEGQKQQTEGAAYLEKNRKKPGVKTTASGLQYEVLKSGSGPKPKLGATVVVHYQGALIDGTVFDSSVARGQPATFALTQLIPGWLEALPLMSTGDKWRITLPSALGYGPRGHAKIPPNAVLVFELELLQVKS